MCASSELQALERRAVTVILESSSFSKYPGLVVLLLLFSNGHTLMHSEGYPCNQHIQRITLGGRKKLLYTTYHHGSQALVKLRESRDFQTLDVPATNSARATHSDCKIAQRGIERTRTNVCIVEYWQDVAL